MRAWTHTFYSIRRHYLTEFIISVLCLNCDIPDNKLHQPHHKPKAFKKSMFISSDKLVKASDNVQMKRCYC